MEQRSAVRWQPAGKNTAFFIENTAAEKINLRDVSSGGMSGTFSRPLSIGEKVEGKVEFFYGETQINIPFFVEGEVVRLNETGGQWDAAVRFSRILRSSQVV